MLIEFGEGQALIFYSTITKAIPEAQSVIHDEKTHEKQLIGLIDEELLDYIGSVVLGLNDELVDLTGALVGLTLAFLKSETIEINFISMMVAAL
jgi:VIT1/CCC1 family predicted Fe2+/Mn2+ transporter